MGLPTEIRLRVYSYVFGTIDIKITMASETVPCASCGVTHPTNHISEIDILDQELTRTKPVIIRVNKQICQESRLEFEMATNKLTLDTLVGTWTHGNLECQKQALSHCCGRLPLAFVKALDIDGNATRIEWSLLPQLQTISYRSASCGIAPEPCLLNVRLGQVIPQPRFLVKLKAMQNQFLARFLTVLPSTIFDSLPALRNISLIFSVETSMPGPDRGWHTVIGAVGSPCRWS